MGDGTSRSFDLYYAPNIVEGPFLDMILHMSANSRCIGRALPRVHWAGLLAHLALADILHHDIQCTLMVNRTMSETMAASAYYSWVPDNLDERRVDIEASVVTRRMMSESIQELCHALSTMHLSTPEVMPLEQFPLLEEQTHPKVVQIMELRARWLRSLDNQL